MITNRGLQTLFDDAEKGVSADAARVMSAASRLQELEGGNAMMEMKVRLKFLEKERDDLARVIKLMQERDEIQKALNEMNAHCESLLDRTGRFDTVQAECENLAKRISAVESKPVAPIKNEDARVAELLSRVAALEREEQDGGAQELEKAMPMDLDMALSRRGDGLIRRIDVACDGDTLYAVDVVRGADDRIRSLKVRCTD